MNDPIVEEVRRVRDSHAAQFNYDLDAIFRDLKNQEKTSGRNFVSFLKNPNPHDKTPISCQPLTSSLAIAEDRS